MSRARAHSLLILCALVVLAHLASGAPSSRPNIVFILADDLGWADLGCYGNTFNETPHIDQLAREGMRFTHAYAAAPVCSPYRAALLTGQTPARLGITDYLRPDADNGLPGKCLTLPEWLQWQGHVTGMIGKWHLTGYRHHGASTETRPSDHGFSWNIGSEVKSVGNGANTWPYVFRKQAIRWIDLPEDRLGKSEYLTDRLNLEAVDFIDRHQDQPFFLFLSHYAPHTILDGRPELVPKFRKKHPPGKSTRTKCYLCEDAGLGSGDPGNHWAGDHNPHLAAMLASIDAGIGMITRKLEEHQLDKNTIIIFTSDNGGELNVTSNAPLRGGKSQLYEGGIRVPLIIKWPNQISKNSISSTPTINMDFYPTLAEALGLKLPEGQIIDGVSLLPTLHDPEVSPKRDFLAWHYPLDKPHFLGGVSAGAIQLGGWKLIESYAAAPDQLFHLDSDPSETRNVAEKRPERVEDLKRRLAAWRETVGASRP